MIAAIGDIHGCVKSLDSLINAVIKKCDVSKFIILGDFVDRGKSSREVTDLLVALSRDFNVTILRGNHEDMLVDYIRGEGRYPGYKWEERIGFSAIKSFSGGLLSDAADISKDDVFHYFAPYMQFIESSVDYAEETAGGVKFFFSHAGVAFNGVVPENQYDFCSFRERAMHHPFLWSREVMKFEKPYFNYIIVHGHIPLLNKKGGDKKPLLRKDKDGTVINIDIDTGCVYGGALTAMLIDHTGKYDFETVRCTD